MNRIILTSLIATFLFSLPITSTAGASTPTEKKSFTVINCNDGDTCRLKADGNSKPVSVRLIGIDAPETKKDKKTKEPQPFAMEARDHLNNLVKGKTVTLQSFGQDMYKRELGMIFLGDENVNLTMVKEGFAEVYKGKKEPGLEIEPFQAAEEAARKNKKGVWSVKDYQSPAEFRRSNK